MKRFDLRPLKDQPNEAVLNHMGGILDRSVQAGEVVIFMLEVVDFNIVEQSAEYVKQRGDTLMNSLRFNRVDWTLVVKKR
ncbi:NADH-ubiquinone oxidoreductase subunit E family protein [Helicobacter suis]|uniref:NADH dehydrogenase I subunit E nuoE n=2 Tax=Helicobacter suis TaxID=104628 RepID=A0A6J4CW82_9HELI|nr:NADH-ubiquinone oxidoreductase subunit E family protein [Helicobacter suis]EFX43362.1 NADH-ubiquinone oxidoreductase chain E [Helicobacter suis HS1]BCD46031.1 NADH dehydrogenase I subunit E nuoE [Helicobacter suis]BCD48044.1 NADH dehydrogenase I subunit E nuoE [Helicobacter suis]BCD49806.1 NADH dehydrogenase I subunit E nuoE [Helicobacter suis]BCD50991.1 NADH dehydrogenase I subunit E nuoE [Helicobacter suis]